MCKHIYSLIVAAAILVACGDREAERPEAVADTTTEQDVVRLTPEQLKNAGITTASPEKRPLSTEIRVNGTLEVPPANIVSVNVPMGGFVRALNLIPGTRVRKGDVLFMLEDQQYIQLQQDYLTARSRVKFLEKEFARQKQLNASKATSDKVFQQIENDFESQKILLSALEEKLKLAGLQPQSLNESNISRRISVRSPVSGYVSRVNANTGKYVTPADVVCELVDPADLHLSLTVFEKDAIKMKVGQRVRFSPVNDSAKQYDARIHLVSPGISEERSFEVHCDIDRFSSELRPGMFVTARIAFGDTDVTAVPEDAVVKWNGSTYIFTEEEKLTYRMRPVTTGISNEGYIELTSAAPPGKIVSANAYALLSMLKNAGEEEERGTAEKLNVTGRGTGQPHSWCCCPRWHAPRSHTPPEDLTSRKKLMTFRMHLWQGKVPSTIHF